MRGILLVAFFIVACLSSSAVGFRAKFSRGRCVSTPLRASKIEELNKVRSDILKKGRQGDAWIGLFNEKEKGYPIPVVPLPASRSAGGSGVKVAPKPTAPKSDDSFEITAIVGGAEKKLNVKADELLLDALENAGIDQVSSCRAGTCAMCACRVTNGKIDAFEHDDPSLVDKSKVDQGFILSCIAKVKKSGAIIAINQEDEYHKAHSNDQISCSLFYRRLSTTEMYREIRQVLKA